MFGLLLGIAEYENGLTLLDTTKVDTQEHPYALMHPRCNNSFTLISRLIILITSIIAIFCLLIRRYYTCEWNKTYNKKDKVVDPS